MEDQTIQLRDGRIMAYSEHGDLDGKPVFLFHGNPGARTFRHPDDSIAQSLGARIITPERPGYGLSDYQPNRTLLDYPADIEQLADKLGIDKFAVVGVSAGGPYVAVVAYKLGERLTNVAIVSGASPVDRENALEGMNKDFQTAFKMAKWPEWLLRPLLWLDNRSMLKDPDASLDKVKRIVSDNDRELLKNPDIYAMVKHYRQEATRQGVRGRVREAKILVSPWGFDLAEIKPLIHLWYWEDDTLVPAQMGRYLEAHIPNTVPHFFPGGGHYSFFEHWRDILEPLVTD